MLARRPEFKHFVSGGVGLEFLHGLFLDGRAVGLESVGLDLCWFERFVSDKFAFAIDLSDRPIRVSVIRFVDDEFLSRTRSCEFDSRK